MSNEDEERMTAIIGIRVSPSLKKQWVEEAICKGLCLSDYLYELIELGQEKLRENVKRETGKPV